VNPLPLVFLPVARDDIDLAVEYYEQQQAGLGDRFVSAVRREVTWIQANSKVAGVVYRDVRAACVRRFPYVVYYRVVANQIVVGAVQHGSRDWSNWTWRV
jgi:plasmid stabilization system protein ParE